MIYDKRILVMDGTTLFIKGNECGPQSNQSNSSENVNDGNVLAFCRCTHMPGCCGKFVNNHYHMLRLPIVGSDSVGMTRPITIVCYMKGTCSVEYNYVCVIVNMVVIFNSSFMWGSSWVWARSVEGGITGSSHRLGMYPLIPCMCVPLAPLLYLVIHVPLFVRDSIKDLNMFSVS